MLKKVLTTTVLGISALGAMAANAAAPGVYITGQLGYANTHMKDKTDFGDLKEPLNLTSANLSNNGAAGRLAIGYQLNQNFAVEMGYMRFGKGKSKGFVTSRDSIDPSTLTMSASLKQNAIDLVGKGILPISDKFNVYGKLGVAYLTTNLKAEVTNPDGKRTIGNDEFDIAQHKWAPEAAIGMSYDITSNVSVDTSWTHIQPLGNKRPGNIDFVAVGIGYNFG